MRLLCLGCPMLAHTALRNARRPWSFLVGFACLSAMLASVSCDKVPLLAPTGSVITLFATATTVPSTGSMEIVATVIEQGSTSASTPSTPATPTITAFSGGASGKLENFRVGTAAVERLRLFASPQNLGATGGIAEVQAR